MYIYTQNIYKFWPEKIRAKTPILKILASLTPPSEIFFESNLTNILSLPVTLAYEISFIKIG